MQSALNNVLSLLPANRLARAAILGGGGVVAAVICRRLYRWGHVLTLSLICGGVDKALYKEKVELFKRLADMATQLGRPVRALELGSGTGVNFKYLPPGTELIALDPLWETHGIYARAASRDADVRLVACVDGFAEDLSRFGDDSFDAVFCTLTMCTVGDVAKMLAEVKRVLRPGGLFLYIDHTLSNRSWVRVLQYAVNPLWYFMFAGCHLERLPQKQVKAAGFSRWECTEFDGKLGLLLKRMVSGWAVK